jgi:acyl carrier protein
MGLDVVGLIMALEDEFGLELRDDELANVRTVGDLHAVIEMKLAPLAAREGCPTSGAFYFLRAGLVAATGRERRTLTPDSRLSGLLPRAGRRRRWRQVQEAAGVVYLPPLRFPRRVEYVITVTALAMWLGPFVALLVPGTLARAFAWLFCAGPLVALLFTVALKSVLERFCECLPADGDLTLGDLARRVAASWSPDNSWERVQAVVVQELRVDPARVTPEANLARDLKVG